MSVTTVTTLVLVLVIVPLVPILRDPSAWVLRRAVLCEYALWR